MGELIPGLPEEVARECLMRVGFDQLPVVRHISRQWKAEVESADYSRLRRGVARPMLALVQAQPEPAESGPEKKHSSAAAGAGGSANSYRMVVLDPVEGRWAPLPVLPGPTGSLPLFARWPRWTAGRGGSDWWSSAGGTRRRGRCWKLI